MKDQYVADINDFLKYAFLRAVAKRDLHVAVIWMLTRSDARTDGHRLGYLADPKRFRALDPLLFDVLKGIVESGDRTVTAIQGARILPGAAFLSDVLEDGQQTREGYFERAWSVARQSSLVFFDPDNGLEIRSVRKGRRNSAKHLYWDELRAGYERGHSIVVYQHFPRRARKAFLQCLSQQAQDVLGCRRVLALTTAHVAFLVIPQAAHEVTISQRLGDFSRHAAPHATAVEFVRARP